MSPAEKAAALAAMSPEDRAAALALMLPEERARCEAAMAALVEQQHQAAIAPTPEQYAALEAENAKKEMVMLKLEKARPDEPTTDPSDGWLAEPSPTIPPDRHLMTRTTMCGRNRTRSRSLCTLSPRLRSSSSNSKRPLGDTRMTNPI